MLHEDCNQGRTLLAAYLEAVSRREALGSVPRSGPQAAADIQIAQEMVRACRALYWDHVHEHGCREEEKC